MNKTEVVRVGTLKLLSERITEMRKEIVNLENIIKVQRCQLARDGHGTQTRDIRQENGQVGLETANRRLGQSEKKSATPRMVAETFG